MRGLWRGGATDRWSAHPVLGACLRLAVLLVPVVAAIATALLLANTVPLPAGVVGTVLWWVAVLGGSTLALLATDRLARRLLPLAIMLELSLVFPDQAPSRLRAARTISVREMENRLGRLRRDGVSSEPIEAAETLVTLVSILGLHDARTRGHSERVRALTDLISAELDLPEPDRVRLRWAALVHDLGKLTVPITVLNGGRDLSDEQWDNLRRHPDEGVRLVAGLMPWLGEWGRAVGEHHERWDGTGYPNGLSGEDISYAARIVAVADSFETMTAARSYSKARSAASARAELTRCAGTQFDPAVVRAFLGISVGKLQWVLGPLTWLAEVPFVAAVDRAGQAVKAGMVTSTVGAFVLFGGVPVPLEANEPPDGGPQVAPFAVGEGEDDEPMALIAGDAGTRLLSAATTGVPAASFGSLAASGGRIGGPGVQAAMSRSVPALAGGPAAPIVMIDPSTGRPTTSETSDGTGGTTAVVRTPPTVPGLLPGVPVPVEAPSAGDEDEDDEDDKGKDKGDRPGQGASPATPATRADPSGPGRATPASPATPAQPARPREDSPRNDGQRDDDPRDDSASQSGPSQSRPSPDSPREDRPREQPSQGTSGGGTSSGGAETDAKTGDGTSDGSGDSDGTDDGDIAAGPGRSDGAGRSDAGRSNGADAARRSGSTGSNGGGKDSGQEGAGAFVLPSLPGPPEPLLVGLTVALAAGAVGALRGRARQAVRPSAAA